MEKNLHNIVDIEKYPKFVPFCLDAKIYEKKDKDEFIFIIADLTIGKGPFKDTYKSDVKFNKKENSIYVTNLEGPLKHLENKWQFKEKNKKTEVSFEVDFELKNIIFNALMSKSQSKPSTKSSYLNKPLSTMRLIVTQPYLVPKSIQKV